MNAESSISKDVREISSRIREMETEIHQLEKIIDQLEVAMGINQSIKANDLIRLPDCTLKTMMAMLKLKEASAKMVSKQTKRTRGVESIYLNQLVRMGYLKKNKKGRKVYFQTL